MKSIKKVLGIAIVSSFLYSSQAMAVDCPIFTGQFADLGTGVIVYLGDGHVLLYNGNPHPSFGRCLSDRKIKVTFQPSGKKLIGEIRRGQNQINWSNGSIWNRNSTSVKFPNNIP